jgi:hypothetical protein
VNGELRDRGYGWVPIGRHSLINGAAIRGTAQGAELRRQRDALVGVILGWGELYDWFPKELRRLCESQGWTASTDVPLSLWQERLPASYEASLDAFSRLLGGDVRRLIDSPETVGPTEETHPREVSE